MKITSGPMALLFAAILAMVATDVMAQRGGGGRPGGGFGGGPGGFGGGRGPGGPSITGLLQIKEVREEIELMPDQEEALKKISEDRPRMERPEGIDFRDRSEENQAKLEEFMAKVRKQREEADKKVREQLEEVLLPEQLTRLEQIEVQVMGASALMNERVLGELKLTATQKEELTKKAEAAREEMMAKMRELFQGGDRENMREKMQEAQKDMEGKLVSVLTSDQKKNFEKMKGEPFEMPQPQGRGGFGGRGGGAPGGGRGGDRGGRGGGRPAAE